MMPLELVALTPSSYALWYQVHQPGALGDRFREDRRRSVQRSNRTDAGAAFSEGRVVQEEPTYIRGAGFSLIWTSKRPNMIRERS